MQRSQLSAMVVVTVVAFSTFATFAASISDFQTTATRDVAVRNGPGEKYSSFNSLKRGDTVYVDNKVGKWCMINTADPSFVPCSALLPPKEGWIIGKTVKKSCWPHCGGD
jgi:uncharacterized protein YraI